MKFTGFALLVVTAFGPGHARHGPSFALQGITTEVYGEVVSPLQRFFVAGLTAGAVKG